MQNTIDREFCGDLTRERRARIAAILAEAISACLRKRECPRIGDVTHSGGEKARENPEVGPVRAPEGLDSPRDESGNGHEPHM